MVLAKTSKGQPILVATYMTADGLTWFATEINFCPLCGEQLNDPRIEKLERCCTDAIDRIPNTLDMLGGD